MGVTRPTPFARTPQTPAKRHRARFSVPSPLAATTATERGRETGREQRSARVESSHNSLTPMSKGVAFDVPDSVRDTALAAEDDGYKIDSSPGGDDVDPALDLVRTMSMSTDKDILKQLRDAMNPKQKQQTFVMLIQAGMGVIAVLVLLVVVIVGYVSLRQVRESVQMMAEQTAELKEITLQTSEQMNLLVENLDPVSVLPDFKQSLENMNEGVTDLTNTLCASPIFAAQCRAAEAPPAPAPAPAPAAETNTTSSSDEAPDTIPSMSGK